MTTWRRYSFEWPGAWKRGRYDHMRRRLKQVSESFWWYEDAQLEGEPFGALSVVFTVAARDQWWANRRAYVLAEAVFSEAGISLKKIPVPSWEKLEPHTNRGRYRMAPTSAGAKVSG